MDAEGLVALLKSDGITAGIEDAKLQLPPCGSARSAWCRSTSPASGVEQVQLRLMVGKDVKRARADRRGLFQLILDLDVHPDGDPRYGTVSRPSTGQPVPALIFPLDLLP